MRSILITDLTTDDIGRKIEVKRTVINHNPKSKEKTKIEKKKAVIVSWNTEFIMAVTYTNSAPTGDDIYNYHPMAFRPTDCFFTNQEPEPEKEWNGWRF